MSFETKRQVLDLNKLDGHETYEVLAAMTPRQRRKINYILYGGIEWRWNGKTLYHNFRPNSTARMFTPVKPQKGYRKKAYIEFGNEQPCCSAIGWWNC